MPVSQACICSNSTVDCSSLNLTFVPFVDLESYRYLNLSNNHLTHISHRQFFSNVSKDVELNNVNVSKTVHKDAFSGCPNIWRFGLRDNNFGEMSEIKFRHFFHPMKRALIVLDLGQTQMKQLSKNTFSGMDKLKVLDMYKNALSSIPDGAFDKHPHLEYLTLDHNYITTISDSTFGPQLRDSNSTVDCSSLNLTFVPFVGLESYRYLNLSNNSLTHISHRQFFSNVSRDVECP
ncbi:hypothetical protein ACOMHN_014795 [Nucella lapillus]